ncbi:MAG: outer membrane protein assembly factor BamE, partial [Sphingomicrobium sp.]
MTIAKSARLLSLLAAATVISGCSAIRAHKGAVVDPQLATAVQPGIDNKESVAKTLGRPTFT